MQVDIHEITAKTGNLPAMPEVALKVLRLIGDPNTNARTLQDTISADQGMTLQILKIANSALYGLKREVKTLSHAILILGFNSIRSIVLASATKNLHKGHATGLKEKLLWDKSIGCALIARFFAGNVAGLDREEAFIGGLMHNMGQTVLNARFADKYTNIIQEHYSDGTPIAMLEKRQFGFSHNELGYAITQKWNLSESITQVILFYLSPAMAPEAYQKTASLVNLSCQFCDELGVGVREPIPIPLNSLRSPLEILGISFDLFDSWKLEIQDMLDSNPSALSMI